MKKTYRVSIIARKVQTIRVWSRIVMDLVVNNEACPEGSLYQQAERLWLNLAISEMPVSGRVVTRLVDILYRAGDDACERGYARRCPPFECRGDAPTGIIPRAQYVLWREVFPTYKGWGLFFGIRRV